jgi:hypothetical protein
MRSLPENPLASARTCLLAAGAAGVGRTSVRRNSRRRSGGRSGRAHVDQPPQRGIHVGEWRGIHAGRKRRRAVRGCRRVPLSLDWPRTERPSSSRRPHLELRPRHPRPDPGSGRPLHGVQPRPICRLLRMVRRAGVVSDDAADVIGGRRRRSGRLVHVLGPTRPARRSKIRVRFRPIGIRGGTACGRPASRAPHERAPGC